MSDVAHNLATVRQQIAQWERQYHRPAGSVTLLAVSKAQPVAALRQAYAAGQRDFAESYLQEARGKIDQMADCNATWHFIGPLQSNKTRPVAEGFAWVHSLDRLKTAQRLSAQRPPELPPLNVCLQVNISGEQSKSGVAPQELAGLLAQLAELPGLRLRGLMAIPAAETDFSRQRQVFRQVRQLFEALKAQFSLLPFDTLSLGMSGDMEAAVAEGSTLVRVGTAIFGPRQASQD